MGEVDVVYTLKNSNWDNNEIKYSIRSIEKHLKNYRNIYIIGDLPDFLQSITYYRGKTSGHPVKNVNEDLHTICQIDKLSENFIYFNDDIFLLKDVDATNYPYYYDNDRLGKILGKAKTDRYRWMFINSLGKAGIRLEDSIKVDSLEVHTPIIFSKNLLSRVLEQYNYHDSSFGILFRLLYGIEIYERGLDSYFIKYKDLKINKTETLERIKQRTKGKHVFSIGELGVCEDMKLYLEELYPNKSKYEK